MSEVTRPLHVKLAAALLMRREEPTGSHELAMQVEREAAAADDAATYTRALALQGKVLLSLGRLDEACVIATRIESVLRDDDDAFAIVAVAVFQAQLAFFLGSYRDAIKNATAAIVAADANGHPTLRAAARNGTCFVLGNLGAPSIADAIAERLVLSRQNGDIWEEAIAHNDVACTCLAEGRVDDAVASIERAKAVAATVLGPTLVLRTVIGASEAEVLLASGRTQEATECALRVADQLEASTTPHPYLAGMVAIVAVRALAAAGRIDDAHERGNYWIKRLGSSMPLARSSTLAALADALQEAGRTSEAYDALTASVALEREATRQFAALQRDLNQAAADHAATRTQAEQLRDEADRDWLTGLRNRRYLARLPFESVQSIGVALVDLDDFKAINDTFGHDVGDRVLVRVGQLLAAAARADDAVVRLGGDEFVIVMLGADQGHAFACAHRLHSMLAEESWDFIGPTVSVGASVGFTSGPSSKLIDELISEADRYLYEVKRSGRGQVAGSPPDS